MSAKTPLWSGIGDRCDDSSASVASLRAAPAAPDGPGPALRREFLDGMRQVAASVTIVTTDGLAGRHGATVSAFASVSADPPTVLVCLRSDSRICFAVRRNRVFTVSVLPEQYQEAARVFAGELDNILDDRFDVIGVESFPGLAPGIAGASIFACTVVQMRHQHTHSIVIGEVAQVAPARRPPLLYHDAAYGRIWPCSG